MFSGRINFTGTWILLVFVHLGKNCITERSEIQSLNVADIICHFLGLEMETGNSYKYIKISVRTSQETLRLHNKDQSIMLFSEIITVYCENHIIP
jgi:hypothetical protein